MAVAFFTVFVIGFVGAWIISVKEKQSVYSGPTTASGLLFWIILKIVLIIKKIKSFLHIKY